VRVLVAESVVQVVGGSRMMVNEMTNRKDTQRSVAWQCQLCCSVILIILYLSFCQNAQQCFRRAWREQVDKMMVNRMMNRKDTQRSVSWRCKSCCWVILIILYPSFC
jgi:hypothetical protein